MEMERKGLSKITRKEYIIYQWEEVTSMGDEERFFIKLGERTPDEAAEATDNWDILQSVKNETEIEE